MHTIPSDFNLKKELSNKTVTQIAFGLNVIVLFFDTGLIQFSGRFVFHLDGTTFSYDEVYPVKNDFGLLHLLEKRILDVYTNNERTSLSLIFEGEIFLTLLSAEMYESFEINIHGRRVIV